MGADYEYSFDENGMPQLLYIDKGRKKTNVGEKLSDFTIEKQLGKGDFSSVYLVKSKITKKIYAMKEVRAERYSNDKQKSEVQKEIKLLENMDHPNVITYFSSFTENGNFYIITEYLNGGSLEDVIKLLKEKGKVVDEKKVWDFLAQTLSGLMYLHENRKIIHRDIKPDNILWDKDGNIKISDFGISAVNRENIEDILKCHNTVVGSIKFMSPEMSKGNNYDFKSDIYMLGLTAYKLMNLEIPDGVSITSNDVYKLSNYFSKDLKDFIKKLLNENVKERPSAREAFFLAISFYTVKYMKITSILSVLNCFLAIPTLGSYFKNNKIKEYIDNDKGKRNYVVTKTIRNTFNLISFDNFNFESAKIECLILRMLFYAKEEKLRKMPEIDVITVIEDVCNSAHKEINKCKNYNTNPKPKHNSINEELLGYTIDEIDESDEKKVTENVCRKLQENFRSKISDLIYFITKTIYQCPQCNSKIKIEGTFNCAYCLRPERAVNWLGKKKITINELFKHIGKKRLIQEINMKCKYCSNNQEDVMVYKKFYISPLNLILGFIYSNKSIFDLQIEEFIDISEFVERNDINKSKYRLIGAIFTEQFEKEEKRYVSYTRDVYGQWKYFNGKYLSNSDLNELQNHEHIEALFYTSI